MKKKYITPVTHLFVLNTPLCLQAGALSVKSFNTKNAKQIGDVRENAKKRNMWEE